MKHNNIVSNLHFHKKWQERVKTWFDQPGQKKSRRMKRLKKAAKIAPRPVSGLLRPAVRCPTLKYNIKLRSGRGFTLDELKEAGIRAKEARSIGISVDHRRRNRNVEGFQLNIQRLKEYKNRLIIFPRNAAKPKKGDSDATDVANATQFKGELLPIRQIHSHEKAHKVLEEEKNFNAFSTIRHARADARLVGVREKKAREKAALKM